MAVMRPARASAPSPVKSSRFLRKIELAPGLVCTLRTARPADRDGIRTLYDDIYGPAYPLPLIRDPKITAAVIRDPNQFWVVGEADDQRLIASVLFAIDQEDRIGKCYGAVVAQEARGHDLMQHMISAGIAELSGDAASPPGAELASAGRSPGSIALFYATTRTVSPAPGKLVARLGFVSCGVFPNVHRVQSSETHGLDVYFRKVAFRDRLTEPRLIPEVQEFFQIAKEALNLPDQAIIEEVDLPPRSREQFTFTVVEDPPLVERIYRSRLASVELRFSFFPFHEPHVLCRTRDGDEVFIHYNRADGYGSILGVKSDVLDFAGFLDQLCAVAHALGLRYIELLVSAFDPLKQRQALEARFLPCAYFPAMKITSGGKRMDYLVFSRSFEKLDFTQLNLEGTRRRYLQAFVKCWYGMLVARAPGFESADKLF